MKRYKIYYVLVVLISLLFLPQNINILLDRINGMVEIGEIRGFWNLPGNDNESLFKYFLNLIVEFSKDSIINTFNFIKKIINVFTNDDALIIYSYVIQFIFILKIFFELWVMGENNKYKTSFLAKMLIYIMESIIWLVKDIYYFIKLHFKKVLLIVLISTGLILTLGLEVLIFAFLYLLSLVMFTSHEIVFGITKWGIVEIIEFTSDITFIKVLIYLSIFVMIAINSGKKKLKKNWLNFKYNIVGNSQPLNIVFGPPGNGKTTTCVNAEYAQMELFYDKWNDALINWELTHPKFNFAKVRLMLEIYFGNYDIEYLDKIFEMIPNIIVEFTELLDVVDEDLIETIRKNYYRGCAMITASPLIDPFNDYYTRALDFNSLRLFKQNDLLPFEKDVSIFIDEFDKEFNSHSSQKEVSDDGTHGWFSYIRHLLGSSSTSWIACQGLGQGLKAIKDCAGAFYYLTKKKVKMPLLIKLLYSIVMFIYNRILKVITEYLGERRSTGSFTYRQAEFNYKRNNVSLLYQVFKYMACGLIKIINYLEQYYYYKLSGELWYDVDGQIKQKIKYNINFCDYYHNGMSVYNSEQFSSFYLDFKEIIEKTTGVRQSIELFDYWVSLDPTMEHYAKTNQRFIKKIYDAQVKGEQNV